MSLTLKFSEEAEATGEPCRAGSSCDGDPVPSFWSFTRATKHDWGAKHWTKEREGIVADMKFTDSSAFLCPTYHLQSYSLRKCVLMNLLMETSVYI